MRCDRLKIRTTLTELEVKGGSGVMFGRLRPQRGAAAARKVHLFSAHLGE